MKTPTAKQFKALILSSFCFDGYDLPSEPKTAQEKTEQAAKIMHSELGHMSKQGYSDRDICLHWLQGLASACTVLFMNGDVVRWWESCTGEAIKNDDQCHDACDLYWQKMANCLSVMIQRAERGYKV